jgi:hypothetical protein
MALDTSPAKESSAKELAATNAGNPTISGRHPHSDVGTKPACLEKYEKIDWAFDMGGARLYNRG